MGSVQAGERSKSKRVGCRAAHQGRRRRRDHHGARGSPVPNEGGRKAGTGQAAAEVLIDDGTDEARVSRRLVAMLARRGHGQTACGWLSPSWPPSRSADASKGFDG